MDRVFPSSSPSPSPDRPAEVRLSGDRDAAIEGEFPARPAPWWLVQGTLEQKLQTFVREPVPYRVAVDLRGVPSRFFDLLLRESSDCGSPEEWCSQELPGISEWLVQSSGKSLSGGRRLPRQVQPMDGTEELQEPDALTHLGQCGMLPGAVFYLMSDDVPPSH